MEDTNTKKIRVFIISIAFILYALEGVLFNPLFLWVASPLLFAYVHAYSSENTGSRKGVNAVKGFLYGSVPLLLLVHISWALDLDGTKTGSSTSALILAVIPVYAFIVGFIGYLIGRVTVRKSNHA